MAAGTEAEVTKEEIKQVFETALFNTVRVAQNVAFTDQQFLKIRDMIRSGDTTDEQRVINAIAITSSQWARTQDNTIKALETEVRNMTAMMGQKTQRQARITESRSASFLKVFSCEKKEFQEWVDQLINQFTVTYPKTRPVFKELI